MISHRHKLIFIHIPKCAGRSISHALQEEFDHYTAFYYQTKQADYWNNYTVFTTVRNPYERLVSMYHYIKNESFHTTHPITNEGNMIPFKDWVIKNIASFRREFDCDSTEGDRERDGEMGSAFWFSSQVRRLSSPSDAIYSNIHILRFENGMQAIKEFLQHQTGSALHIPHVNRSNKNSHDHYLNHYDQELLNVVNAFPPFAKDCTILGYKVIKNVDK
jgi:hypothetical protein